ncbi:MAG: hypothetical protein JW910_09005 [Anaerolineae bacterium]|nr:hypothetical protein [Anaerolineae bacterium]
MSIRPAIRVLACAAAVLLLAACGGPEPTPTPTTTPTTTPTVGPQPARFTVTPSPTTSPTHTPIPPTATPTATDSPTPTPTATATGSPTATPSRTPLSTNTPRPATSTPAASMPPPPPTAVAMVMNVTVGLEPQDIVIANGYLWVAHPDGQIQVLSREGSPLTIAQADTGAIGLATDGNAHIWVAHRSGIVSQLDAGSGAVTARWTLDCADCLVRGIHWDGAALWVSNFAESTLIRLDMESGSTVTFPAGADSPTAITSDQYGVLVLHQSLTGSTVLTRHDRTSGVITGQITATGFPTAMLSDGVSLWLVLRDDTAGVLVRYDADSLAESWRLDAAPVNDLLLAAGHLFSADFTGNTVTQRDPATGAVVDVFQAEALPQALAYDGGLLWVVNRRAGTLTRYWVGP